MTTTATVRLSNEAIKKAKRHAKLEHRSISKQIEYWAMLGRVAEENPDLPINFIKNTLLGMQEIENGEGTPFNYN